MSLLQDTAVSMQPSLAAKQIKLDLRLPAHEAIVSVTCALGLMASAEHRAAALTGAPQQR